MLMWSSSYALYVLIPTLVLGLGAQILVKTAYARASRIRSCRGLSGAEAARAVLSSEGIESRITVAMLDDDADGESPRATAGGCVVTIAHPDAEAR